ncbi:sensor histidine kinase [Nocardia carnea]|uniref:sensor histidine kinase n=1 Tax=Nocardia carnea TaxID=37328 RepID=UPI002455E4C3|nr:histidine kinase [Nocardia carnea]
MLWRLVAVPIAVGYVLTWGGDTSAAAVAALSGGLLVAAARWPAVALCAQAVLLVAAHGFAPDAGVAVKAGAAVALFELALRGRGRDLALGSVALTAAYVLLEVWFRTPGSVPLFYRLLLLVAVPALLGGYLANLRRRLAVAERNAVLSAQAARRAERVQIARDLHDIVAHHVSAILVRVGMARHLPELGTEQTAELLADIHGTADSALRELHDLMNVLREDGSPGSRGSTLAGDRSLPELIETMVAQARRAGLRAECEIDTALAELDGVRRLVLHRTVQEGITNAVKHAGPGATVTVRARITENGSAHVRIDNDTRADRSAGGGGFGLTGMRERLTAVGGDLHYGPLGSGWQLCASIAPRPAA